MWLFPKNKGDMSSEVKWIAVLIALFIVEVAALWNLLG
jgi:hypothetical protein